jgi:hypothetical protein
MKRQIADKHVEKIKEMLIQNYKTVSIIDLMKHKYGITVSSANIQNIKKLEAYKDVRPDLSDALRAKFCARTRVDAYEVEVIKWALAEGLSFEEIMESSKISRNKLNRIKLGHMPYCSIAPKYNCKIEKRFNGKKHANIDNRMVIAIKKEYIENEGDVVYNQIAEKHKIDKATVSTILNFKYYKEVGVSFNSKINSIKKKKEAAKRAKEKERNKLKINKEKQNILSLRQKKERIEEKLNESNTKLKNLRASA